MNHALKDKDGKLPFLYQPGKIPVMITVPHGVSLDQSCCAELAERKCGRQIEELFILEFTDCFVKYLKTSWGEAGFLIANIHRSRIDFARQKNALDGEHAFEDPQAEAYYDAFESTLDFGLKELSGSHAYVLLLDLHGCLTQDAHAFLGTRNGRTDSPRGNSYSARDTIQKRLSGEGWKVLPTPGEKEKRFSGRSDSIIARHHHSDQSSVQIELSPDVRRIRESREPFAASLARAVRDCFNDETRMGE